MSTSSDLKQFRHEDFKRMKNLTPEQAAWEKAFRKLRNSLFGSGHKLETWTLGFTGRVGEELSGKCRYVPTDSVRVMSLTPFPSNLVEGLPGHYRFQYVLRFQEYIAAQARGDDLVMITADPTLLTDECVGVKQKNADMLEGCNAVQMPLQDSQRFELRGFRPAGPLGDFGREQTNTVVAPYRGAFDMRTDERFLTLHVGSNIVAKFFLNDGSLLQTHSNDPELPAAGTVVEEGQVLARIVHECDYVVAIWNEGKSRKSKGRKKPFLEAARSMVDTSRQLSATRRPFNVAVAAEMMQTISEKNAKKNARTFNDVMPGIWFELSKGEFDVLQNVGRVETHGEALKLEISTSLKDTILQELGPGGSFYYPNPFRVPVTFVRMESGGPTGLRMVVRLQGEMTETAESVASQVELLPNIVEGKALEPGQPIGDIVPRREYATWNELVGAVSPQLLDGIIKQYLFNHAVRSGVDGYRRRDGILLNTSWFKSVPRGCRRYFDFGPISECWSEDYRTYFVGPLLSNDLDNIGTRGEENIYINDQSTILMHVLPCSPAEMPCMGADKAAETPEETPAAEEAPAEAVEESVEPEPVEEPVQEESEESVTVDA